MTHLQAVDTLATERYLLDEMTELERHEFEDHYFSCEECAEDVRAGGLMREGVRSGLLGDAARAATVHPFGDRALKPRRRWNPAIVMPWAAAATLAVAVGYRSMVPAGTPGQEGALASQNVVPVTLRPASRGRPVIVPPGQRGRAVVFAVDVDTASNPGELTYDLLGPAGGPEVASGRAQAPAAGTPLLLLFPGSALGARGEYTLQVGNAASGRTIEEFHFEVGGQ